ncbi:sodium:solute symporter [Priestia megaterium]|uniref:sodium:solute symporter n=1 Tax=Priestia megaterium TaxID=1404 RepID=UPI0020416693|nr:sodium:solute symporter [Priestia megaterium]MCM3181974.1 sodium:solute symporter [Priestia megaterium]MCM3194088.1 sodium:solute symporter [Priestia megaterium]
MNGLDMTVMFVYFGVLVVAGIIGSLKAKSSEDFILAGRNLGMFMYLGCLSAVILGGASTIGTAQLGYEHGLSGIWFVTMIGLGIITLGTIFIKRISSLKVTTISELLGKRYNAQAQIISAVVAAIYTLMVSVTQVIGMGTIIHALLGWNMTASMLIGGSIVLFYTILGGMWSVTVTDIIQFVVMTVAIFGFMLPMSVSEAGGFKALTGDLPSSYFDFSSIGYSQIFQYFLLYTLGMAVSQDIWQRVFTARTEKIARNGSIFAGVYSIAYAIAGSVIGMCAYLLLPNAESSQSIFATLAIQILPQGLLGLVLAGVCSALMSTASGTLLASSTLISNDIIKKVWLKNISEKNYLILTRVNTLIVGVLAIIFALWIQDVLVALDVAYAILSGAIFVPFVVSLFWKDIHPKAGVSAIVVSTLVVLGGLLIEGLSSTTPILYGISSSIIIMAGFAVMARNKELSDQEPVSEDVK